VFVPAGAAHPHFGPSAVGPLLWDRAETTKAQYAAFLATLSPEEEARRVPRGAGPLGQAGRALWDRKDGRYVAPSDGERMPVEGISLYDARAFAAWAGKRLPTAPEWARAACGGDGRLCAAGALEWVARSGIRVDEPTAGPAPVMGTPADRNPFGIFDLTGNLAEHTETLRTLRGVNGWLVLGGSYATPLSRVLVSEARPLAGWIPLPGVGIRCVRSAEALLQPPATGG
jgi:formylglycine-generating enzyme required for sulfatase activity